MWVYLIECQNGYFYVGSTNHIHRRIAEHRGYDPSQQGWKGSSFIKRWGFQTMECFSVVGMKPAKDMEKEITLQLAEWGFPVHSDWADVRRDGTTAVKPGVIENRVRETGYILQGRSGKLLKNLIAARYSLNHRWYFSRVTPVVLAM